MKIIVKMKVASVRLIECDVVVPDKAGPSVANRIAEETALALKTSLRGEIVTAWSWTAPDVSNDWWKEWNENGMGFIDDESGIIDSDD